MEHKHFSVCVRHPCAGDMLNILRTGPGLTDDPQREYIKRLGVMKDIVQIV